MWPVSQSPLSFLVSSDNSLVQLALLLGHFCPIGFYALCDYLLLISHLQLSPTKANNDPRIPNSFIPF